MSTIPLTLNLIQGSVALRFTPEAAQELKKTLTELIDRLKVVATRTMPGKPTPQKPLEYEYMGDVFLEVFCNPNIWPSPFAAQVLITVRDDRIKVISEAKLTQIVEDIDQYLETV